MPAFPRARAGASPLLVGVHGPNRGFNEQDYARIAEGELGAVKMMGYHPFVSYDRLRRSLPDLRFYVRLNTPWNELPSPEQFVNATAPPLRALVASGVTPWVEIGNEPNLELHPRAETTFVEWYLEVLTRLRAAVPEARYGFPGLARDLRELDWLEANARAGEASDWLGAHAYWSHEREMLDPRGALKLTTFHARFPQLPIVVTEAGNLSDGPATTERGRQYARFVRTLARLPYVEAVHFFILSGTGEWRRFFFDQTMMGALRRAAVDPLPDWATALGFKLPSRRLRDPELEIETSEPAPTPVPTARAGATPTPTPEPFSRRRLFVDPTPGAATVLAPVPGARWSRLSGGRAPAAALRTASAYTISDVSARFAIAPPRAEPLALQLAETDLFTGRGASATGFALLWDGAAWRLQYHRAGRLAVDVPLAGVPAPDALHDGDWLQGEIALEPRSAAAWLWRSGDPQPAAPSAVFAPPEAAVQDAARPRALFLPAHPVANLVLEGATRYT